MSNNKWSGLSISERQLLSKALIDESLNITRLINSNAGILTNWLYGLSTGGFAIVIILAERDTLSGEMWKYVIWFFLSLLFCIISTALEWLRFFLHQKKMNSELKNLINNRLTINHYFSKTQGKSCWIVSVSLLRILGYISLIIGIAYLFLNSG